MGYVHCCAGLRHSKNYSLVPEENYLFAQVDYLEECPICGHSVIQITKIDNTNKVSVCRKINEKARKLFEKLKSSIISEKKAGNMTYNAHSKFYLYYNEYGVKKKCYSNFSSLKLGLFENKAFSLQSKI